MLDIFWLVRLTKGRDETEIEPFRILDPLHPLCGGRTLPLGAEAIIVATTVLQQLGPQLVFNKSDGNILLHAILFYFPHLLDQMTFHQLHLYKMEPSFFILTTSLLGGCISFLIWLLFPPESGCLTHTPSSLLNRRRSSAISLTGSSLPARESSPQMNPPVKRLNDFSDRF